MDLTFASVDIRFRISPDVYAWDVSWFCRVSDLHVKSVVSQSEFVFNIIRQMENSVSVELPLFCLNKSQDRGQRKWKTIVNQANERRVHKSSTKTVNND